MNKKLIELLTTDPSVAALENISAPVIITKGRALKYKNPACISECLFNDGNVSCYTPYRVEIGKIKVEKGAYKLVKVPTAQGQRSAVVFGRGEDNVFFFTNQADGLRDSLSLEPDSITNAMLYGIDYVLSGGKSIFEFCSRLRERIGIFRDEITYTAASMLIDQLTYRLTGEWLYVKQERYDDVLVSSDELFNVLPNMTDFLKTCHVSTVETELDGKHINVLCDGISCGRMNVQTKGAKARVLFLSTRSGLVASTVIAFVAEMLYGSGV